ncbi:MsnO8 family LLM class oxidoreductase [Allosaccharopolyspora coralli]|uniref:MsnO8 family LLM class oxidoreductase n=1 Tax=Allosaccharopolyspora coralli TaxID=2665642 RepID=A0A5Q3Q894_9PSEU|nr:LLM class flavin-dependent oxidoreductase [Allosaccharopolyspora coralli]QGK70702.1 MsnO8 family LLM class oxidoreductase [Allosaccharopolyspora coralli]
MPTHVPLSVLDLVPVSQGSSTQDALETSMQAARSADRLGYNRVWYAEHHNTAHLGASATAVLIGRSAALTERIRVGSGGVMLPNHAPLRVAEEFGTLAQFYPDRIDLGLGRAPGTDRMTADLLSRSSAEPQAFATHVYDLTGWFGKEGTGHSVPVSGGVSAGTDVPLWILGSTVNGASIAGQLGLPFSLASHFAPGQMHEALEVYRSSFDPSAPTAQIDKPYVMAGINVVIAPTDDEAQRLWTTPQRMMIDVRTGNRRPLQPPVEPDAVPERERQFAESMLGVKAVGSPDTARADLEKFVETTGVDELITVTYTHDPADRMRSLELLAELWF